MNIVTYTLLCIFILINPVLASESPQSFAQKDSLQMNEYLYKNRINYALLYFVQPGCVYCQHQLPVMGEFQKQSGWYVKTIDIIQNPEVRSKFNINATPVIVLIKRNGSASNWQTVSIGYSPLLTLSADVFRLVRLMNGQAATGQYQIRTQKNAATQITQ
ncbi:conjugal transfer protein TraF (plasmid) [Escherichia coli]|jgi:thiol-disulfide isomerase/thioredoxin|nr:MULTISPECIES: conjugal transfer protein TraF [Enterobacteriaceae]ECS2560848.1 thiol reductase thioredoxin [Salmonella enterica subsp. enterica serovar Meleagridis]EFO3054168.1 thiol reductase thioredoxin [Escherichia coli O32]EGD8758587.1 thiol reductase thioredoxin [Shigella flexneri]EGF2699584.1 thiol reductase thioredoxin [Shigella sonnei]ELH2435911.1 conjugal transfer protein TraF [Salmonella enterica subsp. enterica serovar Brandenburg]ELV0762268.1 conjugal transfer protein TraF [Salm